MKLLAEQLEDGQMPRWWQGYAYRDYRCDIYICYPIPFNKIVAILRDVWFWLKKPYKGKDEIERHKVFRYGYDRRKKDEWFFIQTAEEEARKEGLQYGYHYAYWEMDEFSDIYLAKRRKIVEEEIAKEVAKSQRNRKTEKKKA